MGNVDTKPTVLVINRYIRHGGVERQIRYLLESSLLRSSYRPVLIYYGEREPEEEHWSEVVVYYCPWRHSTQAGWTKGLTFVPFLWRLIRLVRRQSPVLIHTYGPFENLIGSVIGLLLHIRLIASIRTTIDWAYRFSRIWANRARAIISNSQEGLDRLRVRIPRPKSNGYLVRNGIELSQFRPRSTIGQGHFVQAALIGRFSPSKNQLVAVQAIDHLARGGAVDSQRFRLRLVGPVESEEYYRVVEREVRSLGLERIVELMPGFFPSGEIYREVDLVLLPSRTEGLPNVIIESMACGIPWIASDVADVKYLAGGDSRRGIVIPPGDRDSLVSAIRSFVESRPDDWQSRAREAREFVERELTVDQMVTNTLGVYERVLSSG